MAFYSRNVGGILTQSLLEITSIDELSLALVKVRDGVDREVLLDGYLKVRGISVPESLVRGLTDEERSVIKGVLACGQGGALQQGVRPLLEDLLPVERFYRSCGGVVGYHATMLRLLADDVKTLPEDRFRSPTWFDLRTDSVETDRLIDLGVECLPQMAEIYPLGGAGDRLSLVDKESGEALPAATLTFLGKSLLNGMIEDLQARENLYFEKTGRVSLTPIAIMTSEEKNNHAHIVEILEQEEWFGRPHELFRLFKQPLVPVMDARGEWCFRENGRVLLKPGGHGVMWKLAQEAGIFEWFRSFGRTKAIVRQVNNPMAGCDGGLLALTGLGCSQKKAFGVASCPRLVGSHEGMIVLKEAPASGGVARSQSNVEYCEFKKRGIVDVSAVRGSPYSKYPSNTNILFVDIAAIEEALQVEPIPGMLVNIKPMRTFDVEGRELFSEVARLESTMQNIADHIYDVSDAPLTEDEALSLSTFLTYNDRRKTISCTKRKFALGGSLLETPEGCFLDHLANMRDLLTMHCGFDVPELPELATYFKRGPTFLFTFHPALGPLWSAMGSKLRGGRLARGSLLDLHIVDLEAKGMSVDGALSIRATNLLGSQGTHEPYSKQRGRCRLKDVAFINRGIDTSAQNCYWSGEIAFRELCEIVIEGSGSLEAEGVTFRHGQRIVVPDGVALKVFERQGELVFKRV